MRCRRVLGYIWTDVSILMALVLLQLECCSTVGENCSDIRVHIPHRSSMLNEGLLCHWDVHTCDRTSWFGVSM